MFQRFKAAVLKDQTNGWNPEMLYKLDLETLSCCNSINYSKIV